jgi:hypothetical protein
MLDDPNQNMNEIEVEEMKIKEYNDEEESNF